MQGVWNRVAHARHTCVCISCTVKSGITRHATTVGARRPTKYLTSSTLLYSGIFAAAATTDAHNKKERRLKWDEAISLVQEELGNNYQSSIIDIPESNPCLDDADALYIHNKKSLQHARWAESTGPAWDPDIFPPQSIYRPADYAAHQRRLWSKKKLCLSALAIEKLTLRSVLLLDDEDLLRHASVDGLSNKFRIFLSKPRAELEAMLKFTDKRIRATKATSPVADDEEFEQLREPLADFYQDPAGHYLKIADNTTRKLSIRSEAYKRGRIDHTQLVLETLDDLTFASAPPSLQTFNVLIKSFSEPAPRVTEFIIRAARACHVRVNERTMLAIFRHYIRSNNYDRFIHYIELMQGMHGGLHLARPDLPYSHKPNPRILRQVRFGRDKVIQKHTPTPVVFGTVIQGMLHFRGLRAALKLCETMGKDNWGLSMKGMTPLLQECARLRDWQTGNAIWEQIRKVQTRSYLNGNAEKISGWTYASMLKLCKDCDKDDEYTDTLSLAVKEKWTMNDLLNNVVMIDQRHSARPHEDTG